MQFTVTSLTHGRERRRLDAGGWFHRLGSKLVKCALFLTALVVSAGVLANSAEAPRGLVWVTLLPLLAAIRSLRPAGAMASGAVWGASLFAFTAMGRPEGFALTPAAFVLMATVPALYALLASLLTRRFGFSALLLGFGWSGVELAFTAIGLKHGLLVSTIAPGGGGFVHVLYSVLGYVCLASFIAAANGLLLSLLSHAYVRVRSARRRWVRGPAELLRRWFPLDHSIELFHFIRPAQPRAPPV